MRPLAAWLTHRAGRRVPWSPFHEDASSEQHGWVPLATVLRELGGSAWPCYDLVSEVTLLEGFTKFYPTSEGGDLDPIS